MRDKKFREASAHASGVVSASALLFGHHPASRLRLSRHFLIARLPLLLDQEGRVRVPPSPYSFVLAAQVMCGVEKETPKRPARSTTIKPPLPAVRRDRTCTAASAAAWAAYPAATKSAADFAMMIFIIDSPCPVQETAADSLSAKQPHPTIGESPILPGCL